MTHTIGGKDNAWWRLNLILIFKWTKQSNKIECVERYKDIEKSTYL